MTLYNVEVLLMLFLIYSFCGWLIETVLGIIQNKKFVNRGFLIGPYCPIYGVGVILITLLLSKYSDDIVALFFLSAILCGTLEYFTSFIMEKLFKARWWDYSNMKYNINGRICLETLVLFGIAGVLINHFVNPIFIDMITKLPNMFLDIFSRVFLFTFLLDLILSFNIMNSIKSVTVSVSNQVKDNTEDISRKVREIIMEKSMPYRRILNAFPQAFADKIKEGKEKLEKVKESISDVTDRALDNIHDATERAKETLSDVKDRALDNLQDTKEKVIDNFNDAKDRVLDNINEAKEKALDNIQNIKEKFTNNDDENTNDNSQDSNKK